MFQRSQNFAVAIAVSGLLFLALPAFAESGDIIRNVRIEGNQRIENNTILSYIGLKEGSHFDQNEIDSGLKNLFATGFFADVKLLRDGDTLVVKVVENPVISTVTFEGNDR